MRISRKGVLRAFGLIALALLIQAQAAPVVVEAARDTATCIKVCNNIKSLCRDVCQTDCGLLFPPGSTDYDACNSACQEQCSAESQECKAKCQPGDEPSPTEP